MNRRAKGVIGHLESGAGRPSRSLVILCQDTTRRDVDEVKADIIDIDTAARRAGVTLVYHTMSSLFRLVVGRAA